MLCLVPNINCKIIHYINSKYLPKMLKVQIIIIKNGYNFAQKDAYVNINRHLPVIFTALLFSLFSLNASSAEDKCWGRPIPAEGDHQLQKRIHEIRGAIYPPVIETPESFSPDYFQEKIQNKAQDVIQEYVAEVTSLKSIKAEFENSGGSCDLSEVYICKIQVLSKVVERCSISAFALGNLLKFFFEIEFSEKDGKINFELREFYSILTE